jgi:hypothetical protein
VAAARPTVLSVLHQELSGAWKYIRNSLQTSRIAKTARSLSHDLMALILEMEDSLSHCIKSVSNASGRPIGLRRTNGHVFFASRMIPQNGLCGWPYLFPGLSSYFFLQLLTVFLF